MKNMSSSRKDLGGKAENIRKQTSLETSEFENIRRQSIVSPTEFENVEHQPFRGPLGREILKTNCVKTMKRTQWA